MNVSRLINIIEERKLLERSLLIIKKYLKKNSVKMNNLLCPITYRLNTCSYKIVDINSPKESNCIEISYDCYDNGNHFVERFYISYDTENWQVISFLFEF